MVNLDGRLMQSGFSSTVALVHVVEERLLFILLLEPGSELSLRKPRGRCWHSSRRGPLACLSNSATASTLLLQQQPQDKQIKISLPLWHARTQAHREREREACAPPLSHTHTHTTLHTLVTAELMVDDGINHKQQIELEMKPRSPTQRTTHTHARVRFSSGSLCLLGCLLDWLLGCVWVWAVLLFGAPTRMDGSFQDFGAVEPRQKIYLSALPTRKFK